MAATQNSNNIAGQQLNNQLLNLNRVNKQIGIHQNRLATGKKINSAEDNAAGFVIGHTLQARNRGLATAMNNVGDARISLSVAESGATDVLGILETMKTKAIQAANGTLSDADRAAINNDISALADEIDDVVDSTTLNDIALLSGAEISVQSGAETTDTESVEVSSSDHHSSDLGVSDVDVSSSDSASASLASIESAIATVQSTVASLGSYQTRFAHKENNLAVAITHTEAARSKIEDADFAKEKMEEMKEKIKQDTTNAVNAQSQLSAQNVLNLL
ncbi:flagellar filament 30.7 kDa core protein [bacterium MnTg02]|nr:flagellar filament 30.7 kDa core protein [bacterium MnTg02]